MMGWTWVAGAFVVAGAPLLWVQKAPVNGRARAGRAGTVMLAYGLVALLFALVSLPPVTALTDVELASRPRSMLTADLNCAEAIQAARILQDASDGTLEVNTPGELTMPRRAWDAMSPVDQTALVKIFAQAHRCSAPDRTQRPFVVRDSASGELLSGGA